MLVMLPMIRESLGKEELNKDRAFGWDEAVGTLGSVANGYESHLLHLKNMLY